MDGLDFLSFVLCLGLALLREVVDRVCSPPRAQLPRVLPPPEQPRRRVLDDETEAAKEPHEPAHPHRAHPLRSPCAALLGVSTKIFVGERVRGVGILGGGGGYGQSLALAELWALVWGGHLWRSRSPPRIGTGRPIRRCRRGGRWPPPARTSGPAGPPGAAAPPASPPCLVMSREFSGYGFWERETIEKGGHVLLRASPPPPWAAHPINHQPSIINTNHINQQPNNPRPRSHSSVQWVWLVGG
jgi:hypothetical protein